MNERLAKGAEARANLGNPIFMQKRQRDRGIKAKKAYAVRRLNGNAGWRPNGIKKAGTWADFAAAAENLPGKEEAIIPEPAPGYALPPIVGDDEDIYSTDAAAAAAIAIKNPRQKDRQRKEPSMPGHQVAEEAAKLKSKELGASGKPRPAGGASVATLAGSGGEGDGGSGNNHNSSPNNDHARNSHHAERKQPAPGARQAVEEWMASAAAGAATEFPTQPPAEGEQVEALAIAITNEMTEGAGLQTSELASIAASGIRAWISAWESTANSVVAASSAGDVPGASGRISTGGGSGIGESAFPSPIELQKESVPLGSARGGETEVIHHNLAAAGRLAENVPVTTLGAEDGEGSEGTEAGREENTDNDDDDDDDDDDDEDSPMMNLLAALKGVEPVVDHQGIPDGTWFDEDLNGGTLRTVADFRRGRQGRPRKEPRTDEAPVPPGGSKRRRGRPRKVPAAADSSLTTVGTAGAAAESAPGCASHGTCDPDIPSNDDGATGMSVGPPQ